MGNGGEVGAPVAGGPQGVVGRDQGPAAIRRSHHAATGAGDSPDARRRHADLTAGPVRSGIYRSRDANVAAVAWWGNGASFCDTLERTGHRSLLAHRAGALPQA